jgi:hypothetical protein
LGQVPRNVIQEDAWRQLSFDIKAQPKVADKLEGVLRMLCFHSRAGKLNKTLHRLNIPSNTITSNNNESTTETNSFNHLKDPLDILNAKNGKNGKNGKPKLPPPRTYGELILSREAEEVLGLHVPRDVKRHTKTKKRPLSASKTNLLEHNNNIMKSDLIASHYEMQTTGYNRSFRRWIDPKHDTGYRLKDSINGMHFVCGFHGCGHCSSTKLNTHGHYLKSHGSKILQNRTKLQIGSPVEHLVAPVWPVEVPWKHEFVRKNGKIISVGLSTHKTPTDTPNHTPNQQHRNELPPMNYHNHTYIASSSSMLTPSKLSPSHASIRWDTKKTYQPPSKEPLGRPLFCKRAGCRARFLNFNNLFDHQKEHQVQDERNKFELLQINLNLQFRQPLRKGNTSTLKLFKECHQHRFLLPSDCAMCAEVEHFVQPQKPCQWYRSVHYFIPTTQEPHFIDINGGQHLVPMVRTVRSSGGSGGSGDTCSGGRIGLYPVVVQGLAIDRVGQAWIVGRLLLKLRSLIRNTNGTNDSGDNRGHGGHARTTTTALETISTTSNQSLNAYNLPKDVDLGLESVEDHVVSFYPLLDVVSWCYVGWCSPIQFEQAHSNLPKVMAAPHKCSCRYQLKPGSSSDFEHHPRLTTATVSQKQRKVKSTKL